jgi:hypothetical protein
MFRTPHVSLAYKELGIPEKLKFGPGVSGGISGSPKVFASPGVAPTDLQAADAALNTAMLAAAGGDHSMVSAMHDAEEAWETLYDAEAMYVNGIAQASGTIETTIKMAGFQPTKALLPL